jgi:hypothetical protein
MILLRASGIIFLVFESKLWLFHNEKCGCIYGLHRLYNWRIDDCIDRFSFSNTDIEKIFLECEFTILSLEFSYLISFCSVLIENPDIIDTKKSDQNYSKYVRLGKRKSKILTSNSTLREERKMSFFGH